MNKILLGFLLLASSSFGQTTFDPSIMATFASRGSTYQTFVVTPTNQMPHVARFDLVIKAGPGEEGPDGQGTDVIINLSTHTAPSITGLNISIFRNGILDTSYSPAAYIVNPYNGVISFPDRFLIYENSEISTEASVGFYGKPFDFDAQIGIRLDSISWTAGVDGMTYVTALEGPGFEAGFVPHGAAIPEPSTCALLAGGLAMTLMVARRRKAVA